MRKWVQICFTGFWFFLIGSIFGFIFEGVVEIFRHGVWASRPGLIYGPLSQVYGIGFVVISAFLYRVKKPIYLFLLGTVLGGAVEYIMSLLQEYVFGTISWDYSNYLFNINGRTSLFHALMWGLIVVLFMKFIYPILVITCKQLQTKLGYFITIVVAILLSINIFLSIVASIRQDERKHHIPPKNKFEQFIDCHYPDSRMDSIYKNKMYRHEK